jgi:alpha-mannosidase
VQVVSLEAGARQVEFDTFIDWQERQTVLKAEFPFDLNISEIRSEIQFGHVKRPTHRNTSWDKARFEASMHRWVDMSESRFRRRPAQRQQVRLRRLEQSVRLTLVRGSTFPDPNPTAASTASAMPCWSMRASSDLASVPVAAERFNNPVAVIGDTSLIGPPARLRAPASRSPRSTSRTSRWRR